MAVSDRVKSGPEKAPHRSLWKALGLTDEELKLPLIGVVSAKSVICGNLPSRNVLIKSALCKSRTSSTRRPS